MPYADVNGARLAYESLGEGTPLLFTPEAPVPPELHLKGHFATLRGVRTQEFFVIPMVARGQTVGLFTGDNRTSGRPISWRAKISSRTFRFSGPATRSRALGTSPSSGSFSSAICTMTLSLALRIQSGRDAGMIPLERSLARLVDSGAVAPQVVKRVAADHDLLASLAGKTR